MRQQIRDGMRSQAPIDESIRVEYVPVITATPRATKICAGCGIATKKGRHCRNCGREVSRQKLLEIAKLGRIIGHSPESRRKQSETQRRHEEGKRIWRLAPKASWPDERAYIEEIQPRLAAITIAKIATTLGISEPYAAEIRSGRYRPHPRHWEALARLVGTKHGRISQLLQPNGLDRSN